MMRRDPDRFPLPLRPGGPVWVSLLLCLNPSLLSAQAFLQKLDPVPVFENGEELPYPFFGGWHQYKAHFVDIDADGDYDLLVARQPPDTRVSYLRNDGTADSPHFFLATDRLDGVDIASWIDLVDLDGDGDLDILGDGRQRVEWFENVGDRTRPRFEKKEPVPGLDSLEVSFRVYHSRFADMDWDGDYDYLFLVPTTGEAKFFENVGTPQDPNFAHGVPNYGDFNTFIDFGGGDDPPLLRSQHGNSSLTVADVNRDGRPDLLIGDLVNRSLWYFVNRSDTTGASFDLVTQRLLPDSTSGRNFSNLVDIDGDGVRELFINPLQSLSGLGTFRHYERESEDTLRFVLVDSSYIRCIHAGINSRPALADLDGDGDLDLVIGSGGSGVSARILYYRNTGSVESPAFDLVPDAQSPFASIEALLEEDGTLTFAFGDLDGDEDLDFFLGTRNMLLRYENVGSPSSPSFAACAPDCITPDPMADTFLSPALGDIDADGDLDLLMGEWGNSGLPNLFYFRNEGDAGSFEPEFISDNADSDLVDLRFDRLSDDERQLAPALFDADGDGDADLVLGYLRGTLIFCENRGAGANPRFVILDRALGGIDIGNTAAPAAGDLDGDGDWDLVVGEEGGGVNLFWTIFERLAAERRTDGDVNLTWNAGGGEGVLAFDLYRRAADASDFVKINANPIPRSEGVRQTHVDGTAESGVEYRFHLAARLPDTTVVDTASVLALIGPFHFLGLSLTTDSLSVTAEWSIEYRRSDITYGLLRSSALDPTPASIAHGSDDGRAFVANDNSVFPGNIYRYELRASLPENDDSLLATDSIAVPLPGIQVTDLAAEPVRKGIQVSWRMNRAVRGVTFDLYRDSPQGVNLRGTSAVKVNDEPIEGTTEFSFVDRRASFDRPENYFVLPHYVEGTERIEYPDGLFTLGTATSRPLSFRLFAVRPHPFQTSSDKEMRIAFDLPWAGKVSVRIYNIAGRQVREVHNSTHPAGPQREVFWDGDDRNGEALPAGVYFIRVEANGKNKTKKILILRD